MPNDETFQQVARKYGLLLGLNERSPLPDWDEALKKLCADWEEAILAATTLKLKERAEFQLDQARSAVRLVAQKILLEKLQQHIKEKSRRAYEGILAKTENQALLPGPDEKAHEEWLRLQDLADRAFSVVSIPVPGRVGTGRFTLVKALGRGGMGEVWLAQDERLDEQVALKFLPPEIRGDAVALDDLRRETSRSHGLAHPNIVRIHDLHEDADGMAFITMEYVDGPTLAALELQQPQRVLPWDYLSPLLEQLCAALDYAHGENVIHRDLKPTNLMVNSRGRLKLADFGIAAVANDSKSRASGKHSTSGTPPYMSPQQLTGKKPQATDDIYALGATFYELLTSKPPFYRGDLTHQILHEPPEPMYERLASLEIQNEIPPHICSLIMDCLAKEPAQRPQSASEVRSRLQTPVEVPEPTAPWMEVEQPVVEEPAPEPAPLDAEPAPLDVEPPAERKPWISRRNAVVIAVTTVILYGLTAGWYWRMQREATRVVEEQRREIKTATARIAKLRQDAAISEAARQAKEKRLAAEALQAEANRKAEMEKKTAERMRILRGNNPRELLTLAKQGDPDAALKLGHFYDTGNGVPRDYHEAFKWYCLSANAGNPDAQVNLGRMYENGPGTNKDYKEAVTWFLRAAKAGNSEAEDHLGFIYLYGLAGETNYNEAVKWFLQAAKAGNSEAEDHLGYMYLYGLGGETNCDEAVKWFRKAAEATNSSGQNDLGWMYEHGWGVVKDPAEAIKWYSKAAKAGDLAGQQNLKRMQDDEERQEAETKKAALARAQQEAREAERRRIYEESDVGALVVLATNGNSDAAVSLGLIFQNGRGVNKDYKQARQWFVQAALEENPAGQTNLGLMYKNGLGVETNYEEAFYWFRKAAENNDSDGQVLLGAMLQNGLGVKQDYFEAFTQYRKAADAKNSDGMDRLGFMYLNGFGVAKKDYGQAFYWFSKAAEATNFSGQNHLGWMYEKGWGVDQDYPKAVEWYGKAAKAGNSLGADESEEITCHLNRTLGLREKADTGKERH
ncbi:MAG: protein kinase domain-containing protein [Limisphaerales bacterium]